MRTQKTRVGPPALSLRWPHTKALDARAMNTKLTISASQFPVSGNIARNAKYIETHMIKAVAEGAQVVHFPETSLPGLWVRTLRIFH